MEKFSDEQRLVLLIQCLLHIGTKTVTHLRIVTERYQVRLFLLSLLTSSYHFSSFLLVWHSFKSLLKLLVTGESTLPKTEESGIEKPKEDVGEERQRLLLQELRSFCANQKQLHCLLINQLLSLSILDYPSCVHWYFMLSHVPVFVLWELCMFVTVNA